MGPEIKKIMDDFIADQSSLDARAHGMRASVFFGALEGQFQNHLSLPDFLNAEGNSEWLARQIVSGADPQIIVQTLKDAGWLKDKAPSSSSVRSDRGPSSGHVSSEYSLETEKGIFALEDFRDAFAELFEKGTLDSRAHGYGAMQRVYNQMLDYAPDKNPADLLKNEGVFEAAVKNIKDKHETEGLRTAISKAGDMSHADQPSAVVDVAATNSGPKMS